MQLVDENEGYDSEDDCTDLQSSGQPRTTPVIEFLKPDEIKPFKLNSIEPRPSVEVSSSKTASTTIKTDTAAERHPEFWLGKPKTMSQNQRVAANMPT